MRLPLSAGTDRTVIAGDCVEIPFRALRRSAESSCTGHQVLAAAPVVHRAVLRVLLGQSRRGPLLAQPRCMTDQPEKEKEKSTEEQLVKIDAIVGDEVLGYQGSAQPEHSGQEPSTESDPGKGGLEDELADNRPEQMR